jgi:hypothetical protein
MGLLFLGVADTLAGGVLTGCSAAPTSSVACSYKLGVLPATANADHSASAPGNQVSFNVGYVSVSPGCAIPASEAGPQTYTWESSDPLNAPISNVAATAGVATCAGPTTVPAKISVSNVANVEVATLTCK